MTPGVPGAGIGGLFYLGSTFLLPFRSLLRRARGRPDSITPWQIAHSVALACGVLAGLFATGWVLAMILPDEVLRSVATTGGGVARVRTVLPAATFATALATLLLVLGTVEVARLVQGRRHRIETARARLRG
jgi:hypothetical protein